MPVWDLQAQPPGSGLIIIFPQPQGNHSLFLIAHAVVE